MKMVGLKTIGVGGFSASLIILNIQVAASTLYTVDATTQRLYSLSTLHAVPTLIGSFGPPSQGVVADLAYDAHDDILYATTSDSQYLCSINRANGALSVVGSLGVGQMHGLAYDSVGGILYGASTVDGGLYRIDTITGQATFIGSIGVTIGRDNVDGLAFNPSSGILYGCISGQDYLGGLVAIDTTTGHGTLIATTQPLTDIAFEPETGVLYGIDNGIGVHPDALYRLNPVTGQASLVGTTGLDNELGLAFGPVPEPSAFSLASLGAVIACLVRHRKEVACSAP